MTPSYPVALEAENPLRFRRIQVLFRLLVLAAIGVLHQTVGGLFGALYLILPAVALIAISRNGGVGYRRDDARMIAGALDWIIGFYAYLSFVTDRFPLGLDERGTRLVVSRYEPSSTPRAGSALARLVTTLPHAVVLCVLGIASAFVAFASGIVVLVTERCPEPLHTFQRDVVAWIGRVLAYHASLVDEYPPFALAASSESPAHDPF